ncbi:sodium bile acid symporter family protein [Didymella exigua CBS 183.55]|uniref:Sodium bile acid symporter family protein n=1 Tax=Didymella exigua CBS 183.55 TaxID=1150837 RepID=A0A6A5R9Q6_9PLEO|nr:sodium bile acid symporter family protein [Didymella exigua CBS 183.55]KAF1923386.1 sodium bile acid symporter family protein [Didymella exigua CBS 183.55]
MAAASELSSEDDIHHLDPKDEMADTTRQDEINLKEMENGLDTTPSPPTCASQNTQHETSSIPPQPSKLEKTTRWLLWFLKDQWFLLAMATIILVSSQMQVPASQQKIKRTVITYLSVSVIFFINGCTLPTRVLIENYMRWKLHFFVQLQCYLVCSAATFGIVSLCATNPKFMDPWLLIGFLFVGSAPTTMSSNVVMTRQAHGNTALTVVQSVIGQFLCPFLTPVIVQMYLGSGAWYSQVLEKGSGYGDIYRRVFMQLGLSLFLPMAVGQVVQYLAPKVCKKVFIEWRLMKLSSVALLTLVWQTFDQAFQSRAFESVKRSNIVFIVFISAALYFLWTALCFTTSTIWLPKKDVIACCYCCPAKALAMVVPLTSVMYINISPMEQSKMQIPAIIFQAFQVGIGGLMTIAFRRWIRSEEEMEEANKAEKADNAQTEQAR